MNNKGFWRWGWLAQVVGIVILLVGVVTAEAATINGTVTNNTNRPGRVYLSLQRYGSDTGLGVSIPTPAPSTPFMIRGVPNGSYTIKAFVDGSGTGILHANDPIWNSPGTITIHDGDHQVNSNSTVVFNSRPNVAPVKPPFAGIFPGDNGAFAGWDTPEDSNGNYIADSYKVYWSTTSTTPRSNPAGVITVPAGDQTFAVFNLANGTPLHIQVTALVGTTESAATTVASTTINPPAAGFSISGTINLSGISNPTGNLSVALFDMSEDGGGPVAVAHVTSSPQPSNNFTITTNSTNVPDGTYAFLAFLDMNGDKRIGSGDIMIPEYQAPMVTVNGDDIDLGTIAMTRSNSSTFLNTSHWQDTNTTPSESYQILVNAESMLETITNITVTGGPGTNGLSYPIDLGINSWGQFQAWLNVNNNRPQLTDVYNLSIQYANGVGPDSVNLPVTAVLDSFATPTAPVGNLPWSSVANPTVFSWDAPSTPPTPYTYSFWVNAPGFNNDNNAYYQMPSSTLSVPISGLSLNDGNSYGWDITVQDSFGNQAQKSVWFVYTAKPAITSFTPTTVLPGMTVTITGINFSPTAASNTVNFCGGSAQAATASETQLTVVVPQNTCSGSIQVVTNGTNYGNYSNMQLTVPSMSQVYGQVTVSGTYNGIPGATVTASFTVNSTLLTVSTTTDSYGNYNLAGVPSGVDFTLNAVASGYDRVYTRVLNTYVDGTYQKLALFPAGSFTALNGGSSTTGVIIGRVAEQFSGGIAGAAVTAPGYTVIYDDGSGNPGTGTSTSANGVFYITHVPDGASVSISASKPGYLFNSVTAASHAGAITSVEVQGNLFVSVSGSVVDSSNTPLAGVTITQVGTSNTATSAADGTFTINDLPGGPSFELMMSLPGYVPNYTGPLSLTNSITLPSPVVLYTTAEFASTGITAGKGAVIGRVVNSANPVATLSGMQVATSPTSYTVYYFDQTYNSGAGGFNPAATATDASGLFLVPNVDDSVSLNLNASNPPANTIYGNTNLTTHANAITQIALPCNLPIISASGQVTDATTYSGISNATVAVNSFPNSTFTDGFGYFNLNSVPYGTDFSLSFSAAGYDTSYSATFNVTSYLSVNMALFPSGSFAAWNGGDTATGIIRGRVFDQYLSSGVPGVAISASAGTVMYDDGSGNTPVAGASTGANGVFYIKLVPDGSSVTINATKAGYIFNPVTAVGHALGITSVDVPGSTIISVSGTVTNVANVALAGATVEQVGTANNVSSTAGGAFTIGNIPSGPDFELKLSLDPTYVPVYSGRLNSSTSLTLPFSYVLFTPAEFSVGLGITPGKGALIGRVVNNANFAAAIRGASVTVYGPSPSYTIRYFDSVTGMFSSTTATDASGLFLVRDVEEGANISLNASAGMYVYGNTNVSTHANAVSEIALPCNVPTVQWGNLLSPGSLSAMTSQTTPDISGQVYLWGVTDMAPGPAPGLVAEVGYGPQGTDPSSPSWVWKTAAYSAQVGSYYEYVTTLSVPTAGSYDYVYRYSYYGGQYIYGDLNGVVYGIPYNPGKLTVNDPAPTTTTVLSSLTPSGYGQVVTFTANVNPATATGVIQFFDGAVSLGTLPVTAGSASLSISDFPVGTHNLTAVYSGDASYSGSTSAPLQQSVIDRVMINNSGNYSGNYMTLQTAIGAAVDANILLMRDTRFAEDLLVNRTLPFTITMKGGLAGDFSTPAATATTVRSLRIRLGKVIANRLVVKPD